MKNAFSDGVTALDEALLATPVFASEKGLSRRRVRLEAIFAKALRAYLEGVRDGAPDAGVVRAMIEDLAKTEGEFS